ncbi:hypothetical protein H257_05546 [Aphanomyces astaci]|uniref:Uncharacterized protein n=1 Tax=Aphanomyces astaci TaxID=112090 RepID=W4GRQ8_APHAT|nr:hypothetical protein H257_05546 [Aphanomyces astaci]ETV82021.1 hypothetical protein H257_05546 [Aphanomyces astaci]|eukprot:XP_009828758.1 hypothetical protein H257_05546 [Aphanomyces astaci]
MGIARHTIRSWQHQRFELLAYDGNKKCNKLVPGGLYEEFPYLSDLVEFINRVRDNERALTTTHMITWIKLNQRDWLFNYLSTKKPYAAYSSLLKLLQCFCKRHGFTRQRPTRNKLKQLCWPFPVFHACRTRRRFVPSMRASPPHRGCASRIRAYDDAKIVSFRITYCYVELHYSILVEIKRTANIVVTPLA